MATSPDTTKTAKPKRASRAKKAPGAITKNATQPAASSAEPRPTAKKQAVVHIHKTPGGPSGTVPLAVNGRVHQLPVGSDVSVSAEVAEAIANSHLDHSIVSPATGEGAAASGSAAPSTTVTGTAVRGDTPDPATSNPAEAPHELSQVADVNIVKESQGAGSVPDQSKAA